MTSKGKGLSDSNILRVSRITAVQSAAGAFVETEHDTQLSIERGVIWQIRMIEFGANIAGVPVFDIPAAGALEFVQFQITKDSQSSIVTLADPSLVAKQSEALERSSAIGTDAGPLYFKMKSPWRIVYPIPVPYAAQNIYFGFDASNIVALTVNCRIFYTLQQVTDKYFFRVAQSLLS